MYIQSGTIFGIYSFAFDDMTIVILNIRYTCYSSATSAVIWVRTTCASGDEPSSSEEANSKMETTFFISLQLADRNIFQNSFEDHRVPRTTSHSQNLGGETPPGNGVWALGRAVLAGLFHGKLSIPQYLLRNRSQVNASRFAFRRSFSPSVSEGKMNSLTGQPGTWIEQPRKTSIPDSRGTAVRETRSVELAGMEWRDDCISSFTPTVLVKGQFTKSWIYSHTYYLKDRCSNSKSNMNRFTKVMRNSSGSFSTARNRVWVTVVNTGER